MSTERILTRTIQEFVGVEADGIWGPNSARAVLSKLEIPEPAAPEVKEFTPGTVLSAPPSPSQKNDYFGRPREGYPFLGKVRSPYTLRLSWERASTLTSFSAHQKSVSKFEAMLNGWLEHFGQDGIEHYGLDLFGGCYNHRSIRGGQSWSDHAYGAAIDFDPDRNGLRTSCAQSFMPVTAIRIAEACGIRNIGASMDRDCMHFADIDYGIFKGETLNP